VFLVCAVPAADGVQLINGNEVAKSLRAAMKEEIDALRATLNQTASDAAAGSAAAADGAAAAAPSAAGPGGVLPTLAVVLVGLRKDSQTYVNMKTKACAEVGVLAAQYDLPTETSQEELLQLIARLNSDRHTHGILVQLPLPSHMDAEAILATIDPAKDVDGLTTPNAGDLLRNGHKAKLIPCTPLGCIALLDYYKFPIAGKHAVVVGRSALVGKPVAQLLLSRDATVTMCHSKTANLEEVVRSADIVVAAIGRAHTLKGSLDTACTHAANAAALQTRMHLHAPTMAAMHWCCVTGPCGLLFDPRPHAIRRPSYCRALCVLCSDWFKRGCVVLDVGTNAVDDATKKAGFRLVGDVQFAEARAAGNVQAITPVPGGVGPMTVTMLLRNTISAYKQQIKDAQAKNAQASA
jgi:5,10-methylene-tetrahydrofolate dehydrogenase/methenyl tetrahydrofolate cyclohydrolase